MRRGLGYGALALLPLCCIGPPLIVAVGLGAALVWIGSAVAAVAALAVGGAVLATHVRRRRTTACRQPCENVAEPS